MNLNLDIGHASRAGRKAVNEDFAAALLPEPHEAAHGAIAAIADGVSTGGMGLEAAQTTVTSVVRDYFGTPPTWDSTVALDRVIAAQNGWLAGINRRRDPVCGLTTLTALVLRGHGWALAHVGDTRAYLLRAGELTQLTQDHVAGGGDFEHNRLIRAIGNEDRVVVDYAQGDLLAGDRFILLSDGVYKPLRAKALSALARGAADSAQALGEALVQAAYDAGGSDNLTALVVEVRGLAEARLSDHRRHATDLPLPPRLNVGDLHDGLRVQAVVADNGLHIVYRVLDEASGHAYALKTLHPARWRDPEERAGLAHEAWLAERLSTARAGEHLPMPRQPPRPPSSCYLLVDWHEGETLDQLLERQAARGEAVAVPQALNIATQAARALGALHRQGVIHRDIKPANLHLGADGQLRLLDLGVALSGRESEATRALHAGTPSYVNPEQWGFGIHNGLVDTNRPPEPANAQGDLFALGVTLYQLLTGGKLPYGEVLPHQSGRYWRDAQPPSRRNPQVPVWLDLIALKAVARDQRQRFETAEELLLALERGASRPLTAPPATPLIQRDPTVPWKLLLGVSALLNLLLVFWLLFLPR